ncbi:ABC transporter substrate-binding protein [Caldicellulosiruptoraceae bacterium PP1]
MKFIKQSILIILIIIITINFSSCSNLNENKYNSSQIIHKINYNTNYSLNLRNINNDLFLSIVEPITLNPVLNNNAETKYLLELCYEPLFRIDNGVIIPILADKIDISDNYRIINVKLKNNVFFNNNQRLKSSDVYQSFMLSKNINNDLYKNIKESLIELYIINDLNIRFIFKNSTYYNLFLLQDIPIIKFDKNRIYEKEYIPFGTGPYMVSSVKPKDELILTSNNLYYKNQPHINTIKVKYVKDLKGELNLFNSKLTDLLISENSDWKYNFDSNYYNYIDFTTNIFECILFNERKYPTNIIEIRKNVYSLIDISKILNDSYYGQLEENYYPIHPYFLKNNLKPKKYKPKISWYNPKKIIILVNQENKYRISLAYYLKDILEANKFQVDLQIINFNDYSNKINNGEFNIAICGLRVDTPIGFNTLFGIAGSNIISKWIFNDIYNFKSVDDFNQKLKDINVKMENYFPFIGLGFKKGSIIYDKRFNIIIKPQFNIPINNSNLWLIK